MRDETPTPLEIEFLYLDDTACGRCRGTGAALDRAIAATMPAMAVLGLSPVMARRHVRSTEEAEALAFDASPTIRIEGRDIQPEIALSPCRECGDLCGCPGHVDCRVWRWGNREETEAPEDMLVAAILSAALARIGDEATPDIRAKSPDGGAAVQRFLDGRAPAADERPRGSATAALSAGGCGCAPLCCDGGRP